MSRPLRINFYGPEWESLKQWLLESKEQKLDLLVQAESWDHSNKVRGALSLINEILAQEKAAKSGR